MASISHIHPNKNIVRGDFMDIYDDLSEQKKGFFRLFLYESLKNYLIFPEGLMPGYSGRYEEVRQGKALIDIPWGLKPTEILLTDEQILFGINIGRRKLSRKNSPAQESSHSFSKIRKIYIDSTINEKIAILKFLEKQKKPIDNQTRDNIVSIMDYRSTK